MLQSNSAGGEKNPSFKWGAKKGVGRTNKNVLFYESFTLEGIEYRLFDSAYFFVYGQGETSIGKLVRMFETSEGEKKVKVVWFFRPIDIRNFLGEYKPRWDELFLACGDEKGVYNVNDVEAIMGKCNVLCISSDPRNPRPARNEWRTNNYVFSCTFNTRLKIISEDFADAIAGIGVGNFFNKTRDKQPLQVLNSSAAANSRASPMKSFTSELGSTKLGKKDNRDGNLTSRTSSTKKGFFPEDHHVYVKTDITSRGLKTKTRDFSDSGSSVHLKPSKKRKLILNTPETDDSDDSGPRPGEKKVTKNPPLVEKARTQNIDKGSWYKKLPFEDELKVAIEEGRFLLIENLEPSYTSMEVEDLFRQVFNENVDAKMIPSSLMSSPHTGRALVILKTKKAADSAMSRLTEGCLMLPNQRPLVGSKKVPVEVEKCRSFTGHLSLLDRSLMTTQKRKAVATSHCAQPNHIVYPMAFEWLALQAKSESKWKNLFEKQAEEIDIVRSKNHQGTEGKEQCAKNPFS